MSALDSLEQAIQRLAEEPFVRILGDWLLPQHVARALARAIEDGGLSDSATPSSAPLCYMVEMNPADLDYLRQAHPDLERQLEAALARTVVQRHLVRPPVVVLKEDERVLPRDVRIQVTICAESPVDATRELRSTLRPVREPSVSPLDEGRAYLVIEGERIFDLQQSRIRIGRALDNDLILDVPQVSRHHAVLELRSGRHVLRDLKSTRGTWVNGVRVTEAVLHSGDVISLADVEMVYAESASLGCPDGGRTQQIPRAEG